MSTDPNIEPGPDKIQTVRVDFQLLFQSVPGLILVLSPDQDFTIAAMSDAYSKRSMQRREDAIGKGLFTVFPDDPTDAEATGSSNLRSSLKQVLEYKRADSMPLQKYNIRRPDGSFEVGYWSTVNSPVLDTLGNVLYIIHKTEDITEYVKMKNPQERSYTSFNSDLNRVEAEIFLRAQEVQRTNESLKSNSTRLLHLRDDLLNQLYERNWELERAKEAVENERENFRNLFRQIPEMVCILSGPEHVFEFVNEAHIRALTFDATGMSVRQSQDKRSRLQHAFDKTDQYY